MHFIQLLLKIANLLFDGSLPIDQLLIIFLRCLCFIRDLSDFHQFHDCMFHEIEALFFRICRKNLIFLIRRQTEIFG